MSLSLVDKQFLRSVADLVVNKPTLAKQFFNSSNISDMEIFIPIKDIIDYVDNDEDFISLDELTKLIGEITDREIKEIFITSLSMS